MFMNNARGKSLRARITFNPLTEFVQVVHGAGFAQLDLCFVALKSCCCRKGLLQGHHHLIHLTCTNMTTRAEVCGAQSKRMELFSFTRLTRDSLAHWKTKHTYWLGPASGWSRQMKPKWSECLIPCGEHKTNAWRWRCVFKSTQIHIERFMN